MEPLVKMPRTKRGIETLNKILSAAAQVFYQKGYSAANVNEIAAEAGVATQGCKTRREAERAGLKSWLIYIRENQYVYNLIWESLYVDRELFYNYYDTFASSYIRGLTSAQHGGKVTLADPEVLAYSLMGATSFIGLRWGIFASEDVDIDYVTDEFMKLLDSGLFLGTPKATGRPKGRRQPHGDLLFNVEVDKDFLSELSK